MKLSFKTILSTAFFASVSADESGSGRSTGSLKTLASSAMTMTAATAATGSRKKKGIPKGDEFTRSLRSKEGKGAEKITYRRERERKKKGKGNKNDDNDNDNPWIQPNCDWKHGETFVFDGDNGRCEVQVQMSSVINDYAPECNWEGGEIFTFTYDGEKTNGQCSAKPTKPEWYSLEEGTCDVLSCNETHLEFNIINAETGILFSAAPLTFILDPEESAEFEDLNHFKDESVGILIKGEDLEEEILFVGVLENVSPEGYGMVRGKRLHGDDITPASSAALATQSFVLGSVAQLRTWSAVALGMCTSDGNGLVSIEVEDFVGLKKGVIDPSFYMEYFKDVNAAIYSKELGYEVFNINEVRSHPWALGEPNRGTITGEIYYSTRVGTWDSPLGPASSVTEKCFIFVDDQTVPSDKQVLRTLKAAESRCSSTVQCSVLGHNCLKQGCGCSFMSANCGKDTHCTFPGTKDSKWSYFDGINFFSWNDRYCNPYVDFGEFAGIMIAIGAAVAITVIVVASGGLGAVGVGSAMTALEAGAGTTAVVEGEAMTAAELFAWIGESAGSSAGQSLFSWAGETSASALTREAMVNSISEAASEIVTIATDGSAIFPTPPPVF